MPYMASRAPTKLSCEACILRGSCDRAQTAPALVSGEGVKKKELTSDSASGYTAIYGTTLPAMHGSVTTSTADASSAIYGTSASTEPRHAATKRQSRSRKTASSRSLVYKSTPVIEALNVSTNRVLLRLRWNRERGRPVRNIQWIDKALYQSIQEDSAVYEQIKQQIIAAATQGNSSDESTL